MTKVSGNGSGFGIWLGAKYVNVTNFDITAPGRWAGVHVSENMHHIKISNNRIHDAGGNGVSTVGADYLTVSSNTVYNNAHNTSGNIFNSGISIKGARDIDSNTGVKYRISGNIVYANTNVPNCSSSSCWSNAADSDGSGIIIDNNRRTYSDNRWYRGRTLISNNVVFGNGGRGVHLYLSDHITVNGNTMYFNNRDTYEANYRPGEVTGDYVSDVGVYNNILYSDGGKGTNNGARTGTHVPVSFMYCSGGGSITVRNNLGYRPQNDPDSFYVGKENKIDVSVYGNRWGNPDFVRASLNPAQANFRLRSDSPAYNKGLSSEAVSTDVLGVSRSAPSSIGAYENAVN